MNHFVPIWHVVDSMRNLPLHWSEGMVLCPQHLQAWERFWDETLTTNLHFAAPYNYGLFSLSIVEESLASGHLQIQECRARMRDGTLVALGSAAGADGAAGSTIVASPGVRMDLSQALSGTSVTRVCLAVPKLEAGLQSVSPDGSSTTTRWSLSEPSQVPDDNDPDSIEELAFRRLRVILLANDAPPGYEVLPIVQLRRVNGSIEIDRDYIPPLLNVGACSRLGLEVVCGLHDVIASRIEELSEDWANRRMSFSGLQPGDVARLQLLMGLNGAYGTIRRHAMAPALQPLHPVETYREFCWLAGWLAVFHPDRKFLAFPDYDHDDLARVFDRLRHRIKESLDGIPGKDYERRDFVGSGRAKMVVHLEPAWFGSGWNLYFGVRSRALEDDATLRVLGNLHWKIGAVNKVDDLFTKALPDCSNKVKCRPPEVLPLNEGWLYFELRRDDAAWLDIEQTRTIALRLNEERTSLADGRAEVEVRDEGKTNPMQFALFVVRPQR